MISMTKFALRRPVSTVLLVVTLLYFGLQSLFSTKLELTPEMEMPMMVVATVYPGASPEDCNDLITKEIEEAVSSLSDIDTVAAQSMENVSIVMLQYEYGTDMDTAYIDLKKAIDGIASNLPDDAEESTIMELDINSSPVMTLVVEGEVDGNLYNFVDDKIVPELEKVGTVGSVSIAGGRESYIRIELMQEQMEAYGLDMTTIAQIVGAADYTVPAGTVNFGDQDLSVSVGNEYNSAEMLETIPIPLATGDVIHLSDVANVYEALEEWDSIGHYNGTDTISLSIMKQQSASAVDVSKDVNKELDKLMEKYPQINIVTINDSSDTIMDALKSVVETLVTAIVLSMLVLFIFFGDWKASVIVGTSIPLSVLVALVAITGMGFSMNMISMGSLVLGVGMMVDNSIVVLESCFRALEDLKKQGKSGFFAYAQAAFDGTKCMIGSVSGSTATTCVVFLPLAMINGMSGQLFGQLGFTIVFCMVASLCSAITIVPLTFRTLKPVEKKDIPVNRLLDKVLVGYRKLITFLLSKKWLVLGSAAGLLVLSFVIAGQLDVNLMTMPDEGIVTMEIQTKPGLTMEENNRIYMEIEEMVMADEEIDHYLLTFGGSGISLSTGDSATLNAYIKDDSKYSTEKMIQKWNRQIETFTNCTITLSKGSTTGMSSLTSDNIELVLQGTDYEELKNASEEFVTELRKREDISKIHTTLDNGAPTVKVKVDPVKANAEGMLPASIGSTLYTTLSGVETGDITVDGEDITVKVEYAEDEYDTVDKLKNMMLTTPAGRSVALCDLADIYYEDSSKSITRQDKRYIVTITAEIVPGYEETAEKDVKEFFASWQFPGEIGPRENSLDEMINEEFSAIGGAIVTAVFLIFIVMAVQFESPLYSLMVMFTIPFSLIGAFGMLFLADCEISMVSLIGFLMMVGTVVNNGILYVETVNQLRMEMPLKEALVEAGCIRIRPILMTTLTTVISMIPMAMGSGESGEMLQGLALVNIGGLLASTLLSLILLPTIYLMIGKGRKSAPAEYESEVVYE